MNVFRIMGSSDSIFRSVLYKDDFDTVELRGRTRVRLQLP
jgi:hypothetical protein